MYSNKYSINLKKYTHQSKQPDPDLWVGHQGVDNILCFGGSTGSQDSSTHHSWQPDPDLRIVHQGVDNILCSGGSDSSHYYSPQQAARPRPLDSPPRCWQHLCSCGYDSPHYYTHQSKQPDPDLWVGHQGVDNILCSGGSYGSHLYSPQLAARLRPQDSPPRCWQHPLLWWVLWLSLVLTTASSQTQTSG